MARALGQESELGSALVSVAEWVAAWGLASVAGSGLQKWR